MIMRGRERETIRCVSSFRELVFLRKAYARDLARQKMALSERFEEGKSEFKQQFSQRLWLYIVNGFHGLVAKWKGRRAK